MKQTDWIVMGWSLVVLPLALITLCGCEVGSADSVVRTMGIDFSGIYAGESASNLVVPANSGELVTWFNLRQNGDQLEATDNNNLVFNGTVGKVVDETASFTLEGQTTAGNSVTISGTLSGEGTDGTMRGTWIEPDRYCIVYGVATISQIQTNAPAGSYKLTVNIEPDNSYGDVTLVPSGGTYTNGTTVNLTAYPSSGFAFSSWSGVDSPSGTNATVIMTSDKTVTAKFKED